MTEANIHGGDARAVAAAMGLERVPRVRLDFSVNVNPLGPPPGLRDALARGMDSVSRYPEAYAEDAAQCLARAHDVEAGTVVVGSGATEIFGWIVQALRPRSAGWMDPCYAGYAEVCRAFGVEGAPVGTLCAEDSFAMPAECLLRAGVEMLFVGTPNNPTGVLVDPEEVLAAAKSRPERWFVVDESFIDFVPGSAPCRLVRQEREMGKNRRTFSLLSAAPAARGRGGRLPPNVIVVKSLTKFFCIPGLRLGMAYACGEAMARIKAVRLPWSVNALAQVAARELYEDTDYVSRSRTVTAELREGFARELSSLPGFTVCASSANFLVAELPPAWTSQSFQKAMLEQGILVRAGHTFPGLGDRFCRLAVRPESEAREFFRVVRHLLGVSGKGGSAVSLEGARTPAIMVVGTTSHAGKSVVAAGLCRYFARRGARVAPFKAQNMALNSFVTEEGGEMGRAQVVQAQAAGVPPHTDMNPVLLKPLGDAGSQVIVNGEAIGNFPAREYYAMKERMRTAAHEAYDRLAAQYELIVMEGAGSPAEINLLAEDFVNLDMADYAGAAALLVADIDRGGVFASIYGTLQLLPERLRRLVKGVIINKFRGDVSLLEPGITEIEERTGVPVLGVLPYERDLRIDDEDSLGLDDRRQDTGGVIDIAVVRLPRVSNFTDFIALEALSGVAVRYETDAGRLGSPDLVILPGSKNTLGDLGWLQANGWKDTLEAARTAGIPVFGICGGYQVLGLTVSDPEGVEEAISVDVPALGFLPVRTVMASTKALARVEGEASEVFPFAPEGTPFAGYEIHMGQTQTVDDATAPLRITRRGGRPASDPEGCLSSDGPVFGCYVHGLFDREEFRRGVIEWLCAKKCLPREDWPSAETPVTDELDRMADLLERHVDMGAICT